jgi:hypothetical protein
MYLQAADIIDVAGVFTACTTRLGKLGVFAAKSITVCGYPSHNAGIK